MKYFLRKRYLRAAAALSMGVVATHPVVANDRYCRDFNPSISYLRVNLPAKLHGVRLASPIDGIEGDPALMALARANAGPRIRFSAAAVKFAAISSFVEQLPIAVLGQDDPFLKSLHVQSLAVSARDGMGFGKKGSRLAEPGADLEDAEDVPLEITDTDGTSAFADASGKIRIERGLVDLMVRNAVDRIYGGPEGYSLHIREILAMTDRPEGLVAGPAAATDMELYVNYDRSGEDVSSFPIGEVISNATSDYNAGNPFVKTLAFAKEVLGEFVFIGAHELGHVRNGHKKTAATTCELFVGQERQADRYAAEMLAAFQFNMEPTAGTVPAIDWGSFFEFYEDSGFTNSDVSTDCQYDRPEARKEAVQQAYELAWNHLSSITFSSPDITTPNPTASICSDGVKTWKKPLE